jgi:hypothetical protein
MAEALPVRQLLAAWALDAVDDDDRARVEGAVRADPHLAVEARVLVETAARLAETVATPPPPELRERVLTAAEGLAQREEPAAEDDPAGRRRRSRAALWIAAGAVATMGVVAPSVLAVQQAGRAERAEGHVSLFAEALSRPGAQVLTAEVSGGGQAVAVITEEGAVFSARGLPALSRDRGYQLWIVGAEAPVSAGVLDVSGGTTTVEVVGAAPGESLALTVESGEGSVNPTSEPIVVLPPREPAPTPEPQG